MIDDLLARLRGEYYRIKFRLTSGGRIVIGRGFRAYAPLELGGSGRITLGDDVTVRRDAFGKREVSLQTMFDPAAQIEIGSGVTLSGTHISAGKRVAVEAGAWVEDARIMDSDFHEVGAENRHAESVADARDVVIGEGAQVGSGVMLLKGATIGKRTVVRPGSVVMRPTQAGVTISGFPARPEPPEK
jgi:acetyltransferase-like isoleucine patch superfamily enzyme